MNTWPARGQWLLKSGNNEAPQGMFHLCFMYLCEVRDYQEQSYFGQGLAIYFNHLRLISHWTRAPTPAAHVVTIIIVM